MRGRPVNAYKHGAVLPHLEGLLNEMPTKIREMTWRDLDAVLPLLDQLGYDVAPEELVRRFEAVSDAPGHQLLVAQRNGRFAGFVHVFARPALEKPPEAIVQAMAVDETVRRGGIGRALMDAAEAWARQQGHKSVALSSQVERADAHAFYESLGYGRVATSGLLRKVLEHI